MVLELIAIGGAVYYYARKNQKNKAKKAAFLAGQPFQNRDGTLTYPADHPGLPPYTPMATTQNVPAMADYKWQNPQGTMNRSVPVEGYGNGYGNEYQYNQQQTQPQQTQREEYRDEKAPLVHQTREIMNEKR